MNGESIRFYSLLHDLLKETVKVTALESQELDFFFALSLIDIGALRDTLLGRLDAQFELDDPVLLADALSLLSLNHLLKVSLAVLCLLLLAHSKSDSALIESLVGLPRHLDVVTDAEQKKAAFWLIQRHLPDQLVEALTEELLAYWADTC